MYEARGVLQGAARAVLIVLRLGGITRIRGVRFFVNRGCDTRIHVHDNKPAPQKNMFNTTTIYTSSRNIQQNHT